MKFIARDVEKIEYCEKLMKETADLHLGPSILATYGFDIKDSKGVLVDKETGKSNSFVRNYYNLLSMLSVFATSQGSTFGDGISTPIKARDGVVFPTSYGFGICNRTTNLYPSYGAMTDLNTGLFSAGTLNTMHIVVGTSDSAESFESYTLDAPISHGTAEGNLVYTQPPAVTKVFDSATKKLTAVHSRTFTNAGPSAVTIKEIGFMAYINNSWAQDGGSAKANQPTLLIRDVLPEAKVIGVGETATITYNLSYIMSN